MKPGDWISDFVGDSPQIGRVKASYMIGGELIIDVVLYKANGDRLGRSSPACGGPRTFEPGLSAKNWAVIDEPRFPLKERQIPDDSGRIRFGILGQLKARPV